MYSLSVASMPRLAEPVTLITSSRTVEIVDRDVISLSSSHKSSLLDGPKSNIAVEFVGDVVVVVANASAPAFGGEYTHGMLVPFRPA